MSLKTTQFGEYTNGKYIAVPFQHHTLKHLWEVLVTKEQRSVSIRTVAESPEEAALVAMKNFNRSLRERKLAQQMIAKMLESDEATETP